MLSLESLFFLFRRFQYPLFSQYNQSGGCFSTAWHKDTVHFPSSDHSLTHRTNLVLFLTRQEVDSSVAEGYKVYVIVFVGLIDQILLNALVHTLICVFFVQEDALYFPIATDCFHLIFETLVRNVRFGA